ncbi:ankyrin repeat domain-containing protein [Laspinema olomoucense]|uniref:ankyrin repeat domain-containing protein n=1 Tax=Laspinema olomoucense TaxID=3231600 RepID=UPI0021BB3924|nr:MULTISPECIES: ankyrin repeat domain-containing protein [unclassified Laspinema]MCT7975843.1 ankyrin repeat domain-containing protein [Laspinema sp. D3d]MCT7996581.1 ankyrin repeat domain-containing protein [Laspinema sp. D3c]
MTDKWDGIIKSKLLRDEEVAVRHQLADAAKGYNWKKTLEILNERPDLSNVTRPDGRALYTPLHQAAHGNAPVEVVQKMITIGAWRTLQNAEGERAVDIARKKKHQQLIELLEPVYITQFPHETLQKIQSHFHEIILGRVGGLVRDSGLRLPELKPLLEIAQPRMWFPVPGMYGGFCYWLDGKGKDVKLVSESWCRVVGGSGQRHEITSKEGKLVDEGFV